MEPLLPSSPDPARPSGKREDEERRDGDGPEDDPIETIGPARHCGLAGRAGCAGSGWRVSIREVDGSGEEEHREDREIGAKSVELHEDAKAGESQS